MLSQVARCKITRDVITAYELLRLGEGVSSPASGLVAFSSWEEEEMGSGCYQSTGFFLDDQHDLQ